MEKTIYEKYKKIFDGLYFALLIITSINMFLLTTVFKYDQYKFILNLMQFILQFAIIGKVAFEWKTKWSNKDILLGIMTAGVFFVASLKFDNADALAYAFLIIGAKGIDKKKILKVFLVVNFALFVATIGACLLGIIPNATTYRSVDSTHARMALGFIYTTSLSAHFLSFVACLVMIREEKITIPEIIIIGVSSGVIYYLTEARIASFTIFIIFCGLVVAKFFYIKKVEFKIIRIPFIKWLLALASSVLMLFSIITCLIYRTDSDVWAKINDLSSTRIATNALTFHRYPISLLGEHVAYHCSIYDGMNELPGYYYIINCSYIGILYGLGVLGAIAALIVWTILSYKEIKNNQYMNLFMLAALSLFFFFEQRFFDFSFNPLHIILFATYIDSKCIDANENKELLIRGRRDFVIRSVMTGLIIAFFIESIVFNYKSISSYLYEGVSIDDAEVTSEGLFRNDEVDMFEYSGLSSTLLLENLKTYDDLESIFCDFNFMTKDDNNHYQLVNSVKYSVDYYSYIGDNQYELLGTANIDSSDRGTGYIPVSIEGPTPNIILQFNFPDDYYIDIFKLEFNGPKPFDINYIRLIGLWAALSIILMFASLIGKKDKEKCEADFELAGENRQDVSKEEGIDEAGN